MKQDTRNIPKLGKVKLKHPTIGDIRDAYQKIEDLPEEKSPIIFTDFLLSRILADPKLSPNQVGSLKNETLESLIDFAVDSLDIHDFYERYSSLSNIKLRFYQAFIDHEKEFFKDLKITLNKNIFNFTETISQDYINALNEFTKSISTRQKIFKKYTLPKLSISSEILNFRSIELPEYKNIIDVSNKIIELTKATIDASIKYEKQLSTIFKGLDDFTKQVSSNLAAINISLKNTVSMGVFDDLIHTYKKQKKLVEACKLSGWPLAPSMSEELTGKIVQMHNDGKTQYISQTIMGYYRKNEYEHLRNTVEGWSDNDLFSSRMHIFLDALDAHCRKQYTLSVPAILPQIEGILNEYVETNGLSAKLGKISQVYKAAIGDEKDYGLSDWVIAATVLFHLENNTYLYTPFEEEISKSEKSRRVTRHTVSHGLSVNYNKPIHSLKAFLILDAISALQKP